jgi:hypothetical protein
MMMMTKMTATLLLQKVQAIELMVDLSTHPLRAVDVLYSSESPFHLAASRQTIASSTLYAPLLFYTNSPPFLPLLRIVGLFFFSTVEL